MATGRRSGNSAFDRLASHYDDVDLTCPACGYEDEDGRWQKKVRGKRVTFSHVCPSCGEVRTRTIDLNS
ncbi:HVO_0649 family zinc finger protein [Halospeciosus flavus]|uniref:HVO_0649 family zinc finger protein n=1 Tax=Halospeciosus flavus TaxID=3032283 RepID=A0ABD5Z1Y8_9EURY|nr:HVO_0649 family zinc finger protein [Halospeciosus flavus]